MRRLAIGDIHGCFSALTALAAFVPFADDDEIIALGDYVDRGPQSREVVDWLMARHARGMLIPLSGNHEVMMLGARDGSYELRDWLRFGGFKTVDSYARERGSGVIEDVAESHWDFLANCLRPWHESDTHLFMHASVYPDLAMADQPEYMLHWEMFPPTARHLSGKTVVCGHTSQRTGLPRDVGYAVCIDTWVYGAGWLTCLEPATGKFWQANQMGETRSGQLSELD